MDGIEHREKRELHPKWEAEEEDKKPQQKQQMDKSSHGKESEACRLLKRLNGRDVRTSAFKIMAKVRRYACICKLLVFLLIGLFMC